MTIMKIENKPRNRLSLWMKGEKMQNTFEPRISVIRSIKFTLNRDETDKVGNYELLNTKMET